MIKTVLFDMDGTLLPMNTEKFVKLYFKSLANRIAPLGYEPNELIDGVWHGTGAMIKKDGRATNDKVFWKVFEGRFGDRVYEDIEKFDEYYRTDFIAAKEACGCNPKVAQLVSNLKQRGLRLVVATNPLFPLVAQQARLTWAGLNPDDFDYVSHYENSRFCKPNLKYYEEILAKLDLNPAECLMVGNDVNEDMIAVDLGMKVFLVTDCLINPDNKDVSAYPHGNFDDLEQYLNELTGL